MRSVPSLKRSKHALESFARLTPPWLQELLGAGVVVLATLVELAHIAQSGWLNKFLYDGDSLALPLMWKSVQLHDKAAWVFSSQFNLFPEGPIYAIARSLAHSVRASLVLSAIINSLLFYGLLRLLLHQATHISQIQQRLYGLLGSFLLIGYMLLETPPGITTQAMATYYLFTTYYYGSLVIGVLTLWLVLKQLQSASKVRRSGSKQGWWLAALILGLTIPTVASNPLYVLQFGAPLLVTLGLLWLLRLLPWHAIKNAAAYQVIGLAGGLLLRLPLQNFVGEPLQAHTQGQDSLLHQWYKSLVYCLGILEQPHPTTTVVIRVLCSIGIYFSCLFYVLLLLNKRAKHQKTPVNPALFLVVLFVTVEPLVLLVLLVFSNGINNRYFITPLILPIIGFTLVLATRTHRLLKQVIGYGVITVSITIVVLGLLTIPHRLQPLVSSNYSDGACLAAALDHRPGNGIGSYWDARPLDIYGQYHERVLQSYYYSPFAWLNNLGSYQDKSYSFVLIDKKPRSLIELLLPATYKELGTPSKVSECPNFTVMQYSPGTPGHKLLNQKIQADLTLELKLRSQGRISEYTLNDKETHRH